jgi:hypothetical protein
MEGVVSDDFVLLRRSVKLALWRIGTSGASTQECMQCILPEWRFARRAALDGHRHGLFERLDRESSFD